MRSAIVERVYELMGGHCSRLALRSQTVLTKNDLWLTFANRGSHPDVSYFTELFPSSS